jgi:hypothetical protein
LTLPAYRLEWSKSYARSKRWEEEVELLKEEMRRTLEFFKWKSTLWSSKELKIDPSLSPALREGLIAYALRQAAVFTSLHDHFSSLWKGIELVDAPPDEPAPAPVQFEEAMQGVDGGDVGLE